MKKNVTGLCAVLLSVALLGGCAAGTVTESDRVTEVTGATATGTAATVTDSDGNTLTVTEVGNYTVEYKTKDTDTTVEAGAKTITLNGDSIAFDGTASLATVSGSTITITSGGTYVVRGTLNDGQIVVNEPGDEVVRLVLDGADITCQNSAPIYVKEAKKVVLILTEGSVNTVSDGENYVLADEASGEPNAAIFSKADLTITGSGALTVNAHYNNGINSKDKLKITDGVITVSAPGNGIKGKDCVAIAGGTVNVTAACDGIKSSNGDEVDAGFVRIDGGNVTVSAGQDGIQAETGMVIAGGSVSVTSGGGSVNASTKTSGNGGSWGNWGGGGTTTTTGDTTSAKALKASLDIIVTGGTITVDSSDDAIHSNGNVTVAGGTLTLTSGDDGVHADNALAITGGELTVTKSYEGLEALAITIAGGTTHVTSSDDGMNAAGGSDGSSTGGRPGQNSFAATSNASLTITDGYLVVNAGGDGLDSNNTITMTGGTVLVYGPTDNGNGAIDYEKSFTMNGGTLMAAGSSGMAESITDGSAHAIFLACASQSAGTLVRVADSSGNDVMTVAPNKTFSSVVIASPAMQAGERYTVYIGGSCTGTVTDGVYTGGSYTAGSTSTTATLSGVSTTVNLGGSVSGMGGGMGRPQMR